MTMPIMLPTIIPIFGFGPVASLGPIDAMYNEIIYSPHIPAGDPVEVVADVVGVGACEVIAAVDVADEVKEVAVTMTMVDVNAGNEARDLFLLMSNTSISYSPGSTSCIALFFVIVLMFSLIISTE